MRPAIFSDDVLDWNLELGYHGNPYRDGQYTLRINGRLIEEIPFVPKPVRIQVPLARSEVQGSFSGSKLQLKYPIIVDGTLMNLMIIHNRATKFTKATLGKFFDKSSGKTLDKLPPLNIIHNALNLKVQIVYDKN